MMKVTGNGVPGAVGQGCRALIPGLEVPWINGARKIRQGVGSGAEGKGLSAACCINCGFHCF